MCILPITISTNPVEKVRTKKRDKIILFSCTTISIDLNDSLDIDNIYTKWKQLITPK